MSSITLSLLESHLWKAAWLLKGPVDAADCKTYILPLLFFKRLSDVHDEEHAASLAEFEGESIYDPTCGTGGMLLEAIHHVKETRGDVRTLWGKLYGQEKNLTTYAISRVVTLDEIAATDHNLNIPRYVEPTVTSAVLTVEEAMKRQRESADAASAAEERLVTILIKEGLLI
jgi:type I restriction-modification system DNA methylase subunit